MGTIDPAALGVFVVVFEDRPDGGLRVYSDDIPGFVLSHPNKDTVLADVQPALETIIGEMLEQRVSVQPVDAVKSPFPWFKEAKRETKSYRILRLAA